jgi:hypothetical protein
MASPEPQGLAGAFSASEAHARRLTPSRAAAAGLPEAAWGSGADVGRQGCSYGAIDSPAATRSRR